MFTLESQGSTSYLVYALENGEEIDTLSLGMLSNNKITGFAPCIFTQMDQNRFFKFNVSSKVVLSQFMTAQFTKSRLVSLFTNILDAVMLADDYMIAPSSIAIDVDSIYVDVSTCAVALICVPIMNKEISNKDVKQFLKEFLFNIQVDPSENTDYLGKIINYLNANKEASLEDLRLFLLSLSQNAPSGVAMQVTPQPQPQVVQPQQVVAQPTIQSAPAPQPMIPQPQVNQVAPAPQPSAIPPVPNMKANVPPTPQAPATGLEPGEKEISMLDLLMHYNKENAAKYKDQKARKNAAKASAAQSAIPTTPTKSAPPVPPQTIGGRIMPKPPIPGQPAVPPQPNKMPAAPAPAQAKPATPMSAPVAPTVSAVVPQATINPQAGAMGSVSFGETTVLSSNGIGETTVLSQAALEPVAPHLVRTKTGEKIYVNKAVFRIGKERNFVDYFIGDNSSISRSHANIISKGNAYYVEDTNSTNHTFVNGGMIQSNVQVPISHGCKIRFANEEFEFFEH